MKTGRWRNMGWCLALAALGTLEAATPASAQQRNDRECRCVDSDGNRIDNCTCFRVPTPPPVPEVFGFLGPNGDLRVSASAVRPRLGVSVSVQQDEALNTQGARVTDVMEDGPADDAGIREGDIITSVDGRSLFQPLDDDVEGDFDLDRSIPVQRLLAIARDLEPGESVEVGYLRDGQERTATLEVEDLAGVWGAWARDFTAELRPQMGRLRSQLQDQRVNVDRVREQTRLLERAMPLVMSGGAAFGLRVMDLTPGLEEYFGVDDGVLVTDVDEDSTLGVQAGDVILRIGDREATTPDRVRRLLATYEDGEGVTFRVSRNGAEIDVLGRMGN